MNFSWIFFYSICPFGFIHTSPLVMRYSFLFLNYLTFYPTLTPFTVYSTRIYLFYALYYILLLKNERVLYRRINHVRKIVYKYKSPLIPILLDEIISLGENVWIVHYSISILTIHLSNLYVIFVESRSINLMARGVHHRMSRSVQYFNVCINKYY